MAAFQAGLTGGMPRPPRELAPWTEGRRWRFEAAAAPGTYQPVRLLRGDPLPTSHTSPGQEEIEEVLRQRLEPQRFWKALRAALITSREGFFPHHRSKATAPCWRSISEPSDARIPLSLAFSTKGVDPAP